LYYLPNIITTIKTKEKETGGTCNTHGSDEEHIQYVVGKPYRKISHGRPSVDERIILKSIFKELVCGGVDWIQSWS
jgi:hypothetical protein